jgi:hypothetical protein
VEVGYSSQSNHEWLIQGHGWAFNGQVAIPSIQNAFEKSNTNWLASAECCFHDYTYSGATLNQQNPIDSVLSATFGSVVFKTYQSHEENAVTNLTGTSIIATFRNSSGTLVASYIHQFGSGRVISSGVFLDDIINTDGSAQHFLLQSLFLSMKIEAAEKPTSVDIN